VDTRPADFWPERTAPCSSSQSIPITCLVEREELVKMHLDEDTMVDPESGASGDDLDE